MLETERLILHPWKNSDAHDLYRYASSPDVGPIAGWPAHPNIEHSREIIRTVLSKAETYAIVPKNIGHAIGSISLMTSDDSHIVISEMEAEIGYWLGKPFWGQGFIPEAVQKIIWHGFVNLNLKKIWCGYFDGNTKSKRVQEKCGFVYQYTKKNFTCQLLNEVRTLHVTCLTKERWLSSIKQAVK